MKIRKSIIITLLVLILFNTTSFANENNIQNSEQQNQQLDLYCESCILVECSTQKIAYEKNSEKKLYPASTTKLLTALIVLDKCNLTDTVTITNNMISGVPSGYTIAYLQPGETYTIEELLNLLLIPSANDAGFALAIHISGSIDNFANLMNETAKNLGCTNSNFTNPSGIHNNNHYSTAKDLSIIGLKAAQSPVIANIGLKKSYTSSNGNTFETTNTLIKNDETNYYEYATGLKTGFTDYAGSCIIATAQKDNMKYLAVVLNCPKPTNSISYRDSDCKKLFEYGFAHHSEIIPNIGKYLDFLNKYFLNSTTFVNAAKTISALLTIIVVFIIVKKGYYKKHKNIDNKNKEKKRNLNEFNFKCLNW